MEKKEITIHFPTLESLYKFCAEVDVRNFEVSVVHLLISCTCRDAEIEKAITKYGAAIIQREQLA